MLSHVCSRSGGTRDRWTDRFLGRGHSEVEQAGSSDSVLRGEARRPLPVSSRIPSCVGLERWTQNNLLATPGRRQALLVSFCFNSADID